MKKIYILIFVAILPSLIFAQTKTGGISTAHNYVKKIAINDLSATKTADTLMWFDGNSFYVNATDEANFNFVNEDLDGFSTAGTNGYPAEWFGVYSLSAWDMQPTDVDTAFFLGATSWFDNDPAQADNWFAFGPLTLPVGANSATVEWDIKTNPTYRDGYEILVSSTGMSNYTDFTNPAIYTRADLYPSTTNNIDTVFQQVTASIPSSFNGGTVYIAFHHNATGMDVLWLDDIRIIADAASADISEDNINGIVLNQNQPNPSNGTTLIQYELQNAGNITLEIYDMTGRLVVSSDEGKQNAGIHNILIDSEKLNEGAYYYSLKSDNHRLTKKMVITK